MPTSHQGPHEGDVLSMYNGTVLAVVRDGICYFRGRLCLAREARLVYGEIDCLKRKHKLLSRRNLKQCLHLIRHFLSGNLKYNSLFYVHGFCLQFIDFNVCVCISVYVNFYCNMLSMAPFDSSIWLNVDILLK